MIPLVPLVITFVAGSALGVWVGYELRKGQDRLRLRKDRIR